jgi:predicted DNA-binding transcriptional regulator AlpA
MPNTKKEHRQQEWLLPDNERLTLSIPVAAVMLGISRGLAYELAAQDKLPVKVLRLGNKRMVLSKKALLEVLSKQGESEDEKSTEQK